MHAVAIQSLGFIQNLNPVEISVILFIILLLFGAKRLPELGRGVGQFMQEFKKARTQFEDNLRSSLEEEPEAPQPNPSPAAKTEPRTLSSESQ